MKIFISLAVCVLVITAVFAGCGCAADVKTNDTNSQSGVSANDTDETLKLIETTPDGGTVEQDSDGNSVQKDKDGKIVSVKDKNGKKLDVDEYVSTHPYAGESAENVKSNSSSSGTTASKSTASKSTSTAAKSSKSSKTTSKSSSKSNSSESTGSKSGGSKSSDDVEGEIPKIIVNGPKDHYDSELDF